MNATRANLRKLLPVAVAAVSLVVIAAGITVGQSKGGKQDKVIVASGAILRGEAAQPPPPFIDFVDTFSQKVMGGMQVDPKDPVMRIIGQDFELIHTDPQLRALVAVKGVVFADAFLTPSSRSAKENITPIDGALEKLRRLQGVCFDWKQAHGGKKDIGFVAEDVAKVLPELVTWAEDGESARGLDYGRIVAVAVEGVKEQQRQIQQLEARNAALEEKLDALQAKVARLSAPTLEPAKGEPAAASTR